MRVLCVVYFRCVPICFPLNSLAGLGWLEPLLDRIAENRSNVVTPIIDVLDDNTLRYQYSSAAGTSIGGFDWNLQFNWHSIPEREIRRRKSVVDPVQSVVVRN